VGLIITFAILFTIGFLLPIVAFKLIGMSETTGSIWDNDGFEIVGTALIVFSIGLILSLLIAAPVTLTSQYQRSIQLPEQYKQYERAVEKTKQMLIKNDEIDLENFANLGEGLEGMKAKNVIYKFIEEKERIAQEIRTRNKNVFVYFKPNTVQ